MRELPAPFRQVHPPAIGASPTVVPFATTALRSAAIGALIGLFMAFVGALGSYSAPLPLRLLYWVPSMCLGAVIGAVVAAVLSRQPKVRDNRWLLGVGTWLGVSTASVALFWGWGQVVFGPGAVGAPLQFAMGVYGVGAAVTALMMALFHPSPVTTAGPSDSSPSAAAPPPPRFLARLPAAQRGAEVFAVAAEDHYLRVYTSAGEAMILMRLNDAIAELDGIAAAQTHRSWWVARAAVLSATRSGGRVNLTLKNGITAPVSRPNVPPLRADGWFTP